MPVNNTVDPDEFKGFSGDNDTGSASPVDRRRRRTAASTVEPHVEPAVNAASSTTVAVEKGQNVNKRGNILRPTKPKAPTLSKDVRSRGSSDSSSTSSAGSTKKNGKGKNSLNDDRLPCGGGGVSEPGGGVHLMIKKSHLGGHTTGASSDSGEGRQTSETGAPRSPALGKKVPAPVEETKHSPAAPSSAHEREMVEQAGMPSKMVNMSKPIRFTRSRRVPRLVGVSCMRHE